MSKKTSIITLGVAVGLTIVALFTSLLVFIVTTTTYKIQLENIYKRSFYELSSNINDIEVDISKLIATTNEDVQKEILTNIFNTCTIAGINISNLPVSSENVKDITDYVNKLSGFCYSLLAKINLDTKWSEQDITSIEQLHGHAVKLSYEFNNYTKDLDNNFSILSMVNFKNDKGGLNTTFQNMQTTSSKVPTLIYDGPFADSVLNPQILGLPANEVTQEQARNVIAEKFTMYDIKKIEYVNDTNGLFVTYNFKVICQEVDLFVQITKRGGQVLEITSAKDDGDQNLSVGEAETMAKNFALALGFENMYSVWNMVNGDVIYVNLAPIQNMVIYYPDLIKVKVDKKLGIVTGWEAKNYFYNHTDRTLPTPQITFAQGEQSVSSILTVKERNYALIPLEYSQEKFAYEYICTWKNYQYYIYIDVVTGEELNILRLIKTTSGDLIM